MALADPYLNTQHWLGKEKETKRNLTSQTLFVFCFFHRLLPAEDFLCLAVGCKKNEGVEELSSKRKVPITSVTVTLPGRR